MKTSPAVARLSLLLLVGGACTFTVRRETHWVDVQWTVDSPASRHRTLVLECPPGATELCTEVHADGEAGEVVVRLTDARGCERHRETLPKGPMVACWCWPAVPGEWRLSVDARDYVGSCAVRLVACTSPVRVQATVATVTR